MSEPSSLAALPPPDRAARAALHEFVLSKDVVRSAEVVLCIVSWLTTCRGAAGVTARDVRAWYPAGGHARALRDAGDALRWLREQGLIELLPPERAPPPMRSTPRAPAAHRLTAHGRAVVDALPDRDQVGALRGMARAAPGRPRRPFRPSV